MLHRSGLSRRREDTRCNPQAAPVQPAPRHPEVGEFKPLRLEDVKGGLLSFLVDGTPEQVKEALLDFDNAQGHRAWAQQYKIVGREGSTVVAEWKFKGKLGINPTVQLEFSPSTDGNATVIRYKVRKKAFGIASFFGDYRIVQVQSDPPRSLLTERIFIDSGLSFANATHEDMNKGLNEDARLIREWMTQRVGR